MVEVYGTGGTGANLRVQPGRTGSVLRSVPDGSHLTIIGEDQTADGIAWRHVQTDDGLSGWLAQEVVQPVVTPTPTPRPGRPGSACRSPRRRKPEDQQSDAELAARPCRPGQVKGDATTGTYIHPITRTTPVCSSGSAASTMSAGPGPPASDRPSPRPPPGR